MSFVDNNALVLEDLIYLSGQLEPASQMAGFLVAKMKTKIVYISDRRLEAVPIPEWVRVLIGLKIKGIMAEYNANLEYLKIIIPRSGVVYIWRDNKGNFNIRSGE